MNFLMAMLLVFTLAPGPIGGTATIVFFATVAARIIVLFDKFLDYIKT